MRDTISLAQWREFTRYYIAGVRRMVLWPNGTTEETCPPGLRLRWGYSLDVVKLHVYAYRRANDRLPRVWWNWW